VSMSTIVSETWRYFFLSETRVINTYYNEAYRASRPEGRKGICDIYGEDF